MTHSQKNYQMSCGHIEQPPEPHRRNPVQSRSTKAVILDEVGATSLRNQKLFDEKSNNDGLRMK